VITDSALAILCQDTYSLPPTLPVPITGVDARISVLHDGVVVAFRGSVTAEDWARDFVAAAIHSREHPQLGLCHAGFLDGAESIAQAVLAAVGDKPAFLTGHSLGGAIAQGVGAIMALAGRAPKMIVTFGSPRFGGSKFVNLLLPIPMRLYRRGNDVVPLVPFDVPPLLRFFDARLLIQIGVAQNDPFLCHHIGGYVADVAAQEKAAA
jgi:hypothetical protein